MAVYAKNKNAVAVCNRSGQKMMRQDMIEDGYLRGLLVHPDWYDPYHPQERPFDPDEGIAIYRPAPDLMPIPPASVLSLAVQQITHASILSWTQPNPPGSTVVDWQVWRKRPTDLGFIQIATVTPVPPSFIQDVDILPADGQPSENGIVNATNMGQQTGTYFDGTGTASGTQYYVVTLTADTSNTQSPNQIPNGLVSPPSNTVTHP